MARRGARLVALAAALTVCLAVSLGGGVAVGAADSDRLSTTPAQTGGYGLAQEQPDPDNTITRIELDENGSAVWELTFRTRLATDANVTEYERFQESFRANESRYLDPFRDRMTGVVANVNESSDRAMGVDGFAADTSIQEVPRRWGVVTFRFRWDGFAALDGDSVVVGDVFGGGFFIGEDDALTVVAPAGYAFEEVVPAADDTDERAVQWNGREDFADSQPRVVVAPTAGAVNETTTLDGAETQTATQQSGRSGLVPFGLGIVALLVVAVLAVRAGWLDRVDREGGAETASSLSESSGSKAAAAAGNGESEPALLTDEDHVRRLLAGSGGRRKQSEIVEELDWSKSKTSRVLSRMAEDGSVEKLRIGRENVIELVEKES